MGHEAELTNTTVEEARTPVTRPPKGKAHHPLLRSSIAQEKEALLRQEDRERAHRAMKGEHMPLLRPIELREADLQTQGAWVRPIGT